MIFLAFGRWSHASGRWFTRTRIYIQGWRWTPFVYVTIRSKPTRDLKLETLVKEYLATLDNERGVEAFATARQHAEVDLNRFLSWTRIQKGNQP